MNAKPLPGIPTATYCYTVAAVYLGPSDPKQIGKRQPIIEEFHVWAKHATPAIATFEAWFQEPNTDRQRLLELVHVASADLTQGNVAREQIINDPEFFPGPLFK